MQTLSEAKFHSTVVAIHRSIQEEAFCQELEELQKNERVWGGIRHLLN
jgi:hypothetical protein